MKRILAFVLLLSMLLALAPVSACADGAWKKNGSGWWYQNEDGSYPAGCIQEIGGKRYYFNASGYMQTGWQKIEGRWYSFDGSGAMQTGWRQIGGSWYSFDASGAMQTGWVKSAGKWYYMGGSGAMQTGWQKLGGNWYYMSGSGAMQTGWITLGEDTYYARENGALVVGTTMVIDGKEYRFDHNGVLEDDNLSEAKVYRKMIALKSKYPEGTPWTNSNSYVWDCTVFPDTVYTGFGCVAFAMILSDAAFGDREGRLVETVRLANVRVGDILRINGDTHSVIVLEVNSDSVVIAEGNYNSSVHWGRTLSKQVVESADYLITRYP